MYPVPHRKTHIEKPTLIDIVRKLQIQKYPKTYKHIEKRYRDISTRTKIDSHRQLRLRIRDK